MKRTASVLLVAFSLAACAASLATGDDPTGIEGMSPADVIDAMDAIGVECSEPEKGLVHIGFSCVVTPNQVSVDGISNTIDEMAGVDIHVLTGDREMAERLTRAVMSIPYQGADPDAAMAWLADRFDSEMCIAQPNEPGPTDCDEAFGSARLHLQVEGELGAIEISITGA
jgi:hypothetical protein